MKFIEPSLREVFDTFINNKEIINFFKYKNIFITENTLNLIYGEVNSALLEDADYKNKMMLMSLSQVLLNNKEKILNNSIIELMASKTAWNSIAGALGITLKDMNEEIYKNIMYTYKFCSVSSFFQNNREKFIPENDFFKMSNNPAASAFYDAMLKEFDKLDMVLGECNKYLDFDSIPWDLINYLTQLLGFEKSTLAIDDKDEKKFREIAKSILDLYRIKGTNYSFELLFRFLGFNISVREFYFDRRFFYSTKGNKETSEINNIKYSYYLTTDDPCENIIKNNAVAEIVTPKDISPQYSLIEFEDLCLRYGPKAVLGYSPYYYELNANGKKIKKEYKGKIYKYFKTNLIYYDVSLEGSNINREQTAAIFKYLEFLTPSYVTKIFKSKATSFNDEEKIVFDGDGTEETGNKFNSSTGSYIGSFQMLDGEDWDQSFKDLYVKKDTNGKNYKYINHYVNGLQKEIEYESSIGDNTFRLPIDHKIMNKSLNKHLGKSAKGIYPSTMRLKYFKFKDGAATITHMSIPPRDTEGAMHLGLEKVEKDPKLLGPESVREKIKENEKVVKVEYIEDSIYENKKINDLTPVRIYNRTLNKIKEFSYSSKNDFDNIMRSIDYLNVTNSRCKFENIKVYDAPLADDIIEKLEFGRSTAFIKKDSTEDKGSILIYRFEDSMFSDINNKFKSINYRLKWLKKDPKGGAKGNVAVVDTKDDAVESLKEIVDKAIKEKNENLLQDIETYYIKEMESYYVPVRTSTYSVTTCKDVIKYKDISEAIKKEKKVYNREFFVEDCKDKDDDSNDISFSSMYTFAYSNREPGKLIYSSADKKLYKIGNYNDILEYNDFFGKLKIDDSNKEACLYEYDEFWNGYDEEADSEDYLMYNNYHQIYWKAGKKYNPENDSPVVITRPVKYKTDIEFDSDDNDKTSNDKISYNIINEVGDSTVENFDDIELYNTEEAFFEVPSVLLDGCNPKYYGLYEEGETLTNDEEYDSSKTYFSKSEKGLMSAVSKNFGKYYYNVSEFLADYYKNIILESESDEGIINKYKTSLFNMSVIMNTMTHDRIYYKEIENWKKEIETYMEQANIRIYIGVMCKELEKYCPKLYNLWLTDPYSFNSTDDIFTSEDKYSELKNYLEKYNISDELEGYKKFMENEKEIIKGTIEAKERLIKEGYEFNISKNNFFLKISKIIDEASKNHTEINIKDGVDEDLLGKDSNSSWHIKYNDEDPISLKDENRSDISLKVTFSLSSDSSGMMYIPYSLNYGLKKYNEDENMEHLDIYSEFIELLDAFTDTLKKIPDSTKTKDYLKKYYYNKILDMYRTAFIEDREKMVFSIKSGRFMNIVPRLMNRFIDYYGNFLVSPNVISSYKNNGGAKDTDSRLPISNVTLKYNPSRTGFLKFRVKYPDAIKVLGFNPSNYYRIKSIKNKNINESKSINENYRKIFSNMRFVFLYGEKELRWKNLRKYFGYNFYEYDSIVEYDGDGKKFISGDDFYDSNGLKIENNDLILKRAMEVFEHGYMEITVKDEHCLQYDNSIKDETFSGSKNLILDNDGVYGYVSINNLRQRFMDTLVSYPVSSKWVKKDYRGTPEEFSSFGDDRNFTIKVVRKYGEDYDHIKSRVNDKGNIELMIPLYRKNVEEDKPVNMINVSDVKLVNIKLK